MESPSKHRPRTLSWTERSRSVWVSSDETFYSYQLKLTKIEPLISQSFKVQVWTTCQRYYRLRWANVNQFKWLAPATISLMDFAETIIVIFLGFMFCSAIVYYCILSLDSVTLPEPVSAANGTHLERVDFLLDEWTTFFSKEKVLCKKRNITLTDCTV